MSIRLTIASLIFLLCPSNFAAAADSDSAPYPEAREFLQAHGEFVDRAKRYTPMLEISAYNIPEMELEDEIGEFEEFRYELDALAPIPISRDSFLLAGAHAGARNYTFPNEAVYDDEILYNLGLRFGGGHFFNDDLVVQGYWQPSIYSDLGGPPYSEDWKLCYGAGLLVYRNSETFFWKGGFVLNDSLNTGIIPLVGFAWVPTPHWRVDILAPRQFELSFLPDEQWEFTLGARVDGEEYVLRQSFDDGSSRRTVRLREVRYFLGLMQKWQSGFSWFLRAGVAEGGEYEWGEGFNGAVEPSPYVRSGFGLSF